MRKATFLSILPIVTAVIFASGCGTTYSWRPSVPDDMRTVSVPSFRNESNVQELGAVITRQVLREFQREGTFAIRGSGDAALEVQGIVKDAGANATAYDRRSGLRIASYEMSATVIVSVIDKKAGRVLVDNKPYRATATFAAGQDLSTAQRDASGRLAEDLARQVVDDVTSLKWQRGKGEDR